MPSEVAIRDLRTEKSVRWIDGDTKGSPTAYNSLAKDSKLQERFRYLFLKRPSQAFAI
jgi:hypothetical protein